VVPCKRLSAARNFGAVSLLRSARRPFYFSLGLAAAHMNCRRFAGGRASFSQAGSEGDAKRPRPQQPLLDLFEILHRERRQMTAMTSPMCEAILSQLDQVEARDFGIGPEVCQQLPAGADVGYMEVGVSQEVTLCLFVLKKGASIPLHDHPGMHVFGRLLFGQMHAVSFDLELAGQVSTSSSPRLQSRPAAQWAQVHETEVYGPAPRTYWLTPSSGNLHYLHAAEDCCFFDVVAPPYDAANGRDCTYYNAHVDLINAAKGERCRVEVYQPRGFYTHPLPYRGPRPNWSEGE